MSADVEEIWGSWYVMSIFLLGRCPTPIAIGSMPKYPIIFPVEACFPTLSEVKDVDAMDRIVLLSQVPVETRACKFSVVDT